MRCEITAEPSLGGRYRILKQLGAGASAIVFAAFDRELRRCVALKLLCPGYAREALREARVMASVAHPNVLKVFDSGTTADAAYLTTELIAGNTLYEWAQTQRSAKEILDIMIQAGRGLAAAHESGVVHRDFKPTNVLVDPRGAVKVADFGLAARSNLPRGMHPGVTGTRSGTEPYMSPEEALGRPVDSRADQFSFCASLYELLSGERLFPSGTAAEAPAGFVEQQIDRLRIRGVSRRVKRALVRGLSFEPELRYPTMNELLAELA